MSDWRVSWLLAASLCVSGCSIGGEDDEPSPFDEVEITAPSTPTVADGRSEARVEVRGEVGREFTIVTIDAIFARPDDPAVPTEQTVFIDDDGLGGGLATVSVRSTQPGRAAVFLKANRVASLVEMSFVRVELAAGAPLIDEIEPGRVKHRLCVGANSPAGLLTIAGDSNGVFGPANPELGAVPPAGLACPSGEAIASTAEVSWSTPTGSEEVTISYLAPNAQPLVTEVAALDGAAFPGYELNVVAPTIANQVATIELTVLYTELGSIAAAPAEGVGLSGLRFVPEVGPVFLGSSSGDAGATPTTANDGTATLFFSLEGLSGTFTLFLTPTGGAVTALTQLTVP